jgi:hypothetical protein
LVVGFVIWLTVVHCPLSIVHCPLLKGVNR